MGWGIGDRIFGGTGTVWAWRDQGHLAWGYRFRVVEINEYCYLVEERPLRDCKRIHHGFSSHAG